MRTHFVDFLRRRLILDGMEHEFSDSDSAARLLEEMGYAHGVASKDGPDGEVWTVHALKGDHKITVHAPTLEQAYREAVEQARPDSA